MTTFVCTMALTFSTTCSARFLLLSLICAVFLAGVSLPSAAAPPPRHARRKQLRRVLSPGGSRTANSRLVHNASDTAKQDTLETKVRIPAQQQQLWQHELNKLLQSSDSALDARDLVKTRRQAWEQGTIHPCRSISASSDASASSSEMNAAALLEQASTSPLSAPVAAEVHAHHSFMIMIALLS